MSYEECASSSPSITNIQVHPHTPECREHELQKKPAWRPWPSLCFFLWTTKPQSAAGGRARGVSGCTAQVKQTDCLHSTQPGTVLVHLPSLPEPHMSAPVQSSHTSLGDHHVLSKCLTQKWAKPRATLGESEPISPQRSRQVDLRGKDVTGASRSVP